MASRQTNSLFAAGQSEDVHLSLLNLVWTFCIQRGKNSSWEESKDTEALKQCGFVLCLDTPSVKSRWTHLARENSL